MTNTELKEIYFGAYFFEETEDGYIKANQYSQSQMDYFKSAFDFWFERCDASTAKTFEFTTGAEKVSFEKSSSRFGDCVDSFKCDGMRRYR